MNILFLCCTRNNPEPMQGVIDGVSPQLSAEEKIGLVITQQSDITENTRTNKSVSYIVENAPKGATDALHFGIKTFSDNDWICWLNDDIVFEKSNWIKDLRREIEMNPERELFGFVENRLKGKRKITGFNINKHCSFGCIKRDFYNKYYGNGNPFVKYFWDNEILDLANEANVFWQTDIALMHNWNRAKANFMQYDIDERLYNKRRIERIFPNCVSEYFKSKTDAELLKENLILANKNVEYSIVEDKDKFLILKG